MYSQCTVNLACILNTLSATWPRPLEQWGDTYKVVTSGKYTFSSILLVVIYWYQIRTHQCTCSQCILYAYRRARCNVNRANAHPHLVIFAWTWRVQHAPQSSNTSSARSVGKSENSHSIVCLLNENYEQIAIACVGISEEVWYLNIYLDHQQSTINAAGINRM